MTKFDDGKDRDALRTIGEVSDALGIKQHVLRYWEQQFPMLQPLKRSGGRRYYRSADIEMVEQIDTLVNSQGYTIKGALGVLKSGGVAKIVAAPKPEPSRQDKPRIMITEAEERDLTPQIAALKSIRKRLIAAIEA